MGLAELDRIIIPLRPTLLILIRQPLGRQGLLIVPVGQLAPPRLSRRPDTMFLGLAMELMEGQMPVVPQAESLFRLPHSIFPLRL